MKLDQFFKTLKYQGSIKIVKPSLNIEFLYKERGNTMMTIFMKSDINKTLSKEMGFEVYNWHKVVDILPTVKAWRIYNNLITNGERNNVVVNSSNNEIWLEEDEI